MTSELVTDWSENDLSTNPLSNFIIEILNEQLIFWLLFSFRLGHHLFWRLKHDHHSKVGAGGGEHFVSLLIIDPKHPIVIGHGEAFELLFSDVDISDLIAIVTDTDRFSEAGGLYSVEAQLWTPRQIGIKMDCRLLCFS